MRRNCNLQLQLQLQPTYDDSLQSFSSQSPTPDVHRSQDQEKLTIFYNGQICVCDVTEFQARAILLLAGREAEEKRKSPASSGGDGEEGGVLASANCGAAVQSPTSGLFLKRSLQRFLEKRKCRSLATSPYHR